MKRRSKFTFASTIFFIFLICVSVFFVTSSATSFSTETIKSDTLQDKEVFESNSVKSKNKSIKLVSFVSREGINLLSKKISKNQLISFYWQYTKSWLIAESIIRHSIEKDVPVNLAFSVAYIESSFNPNAYNVNSNISIDRGLFQLNNLYRAGWTKSDFYNLEKNTEEGISYLKEGMNLSNGDIRKALSIYNFGPKSLYYKTLPWRVQIYVEKVLKFEKYLDTEFNKFIQKIGFKL